MIWCGTRLFRLLSAQVPTGLTNAVARGNCNIMNLGKGSISVAGGVIFKRRRTTYWSI